MDFLHDAAFTEHVEALMLEHHVPGLSIGVVHGDKPAETRAFGFASLRSSEPCTPETLFDVASCAKSLTAASVALLVEDDENYPHIKYTTPMSTLLPDDFIMSDAQYTKEVTVEDVLSHRTGMPRHDDSYMGVNAKEPDTCRSVTRNLRNLAVVAPLRSRYLYCNMMYTVATHLVEVESKRPFSEFLEERLFKPLSMDSSALQPMRAIERGLGSRLSLGYTWDKEAGAYKEHVCRDCPEGQGAGSIISSANDFIKWVEALLYRKSPINESIYQGLVTMRSIVNPTGRRLRPHTSPAIYAAGMEVYTYRGATVIGHDGNITGFGSCFVFLPDIRLGVVVLGNSSTAGAVCTSTIRALIDAVLDIPVSERQLRKKRKEKKKSPPKKHAAPQQQAQGSSTAVTPVETNTHRGDKSDIYAKSIANVGTGTIHLDEQLQRLDLNAKLNEGPGIQLDAYAGIYSHPGYRNMEVVVRGETLYIDATDRSMGFTLTMEYVSNQSSFTAYLTDALEGAIETIDARFELSDGRGVRLGLDLEPAVRDLIWFDLDNGQLHA